MKELLVVLMKNMSLNCGMKIHDQGEIELWPEQADKKK